MEKTASTGEVSEHKLPSPRPINTTPAQTGPFYLRRNHVLQEIDRCFAQSEPLAKRVVLHGFLGIGKTQIALDYAQTAARSSNVFWARADTWFNLIHDYGHLVKALRPRESLPGDPALLLSRVKSLLEDSSAREWLLVLDDFCNEQGEILRMLVTCNMLPRNTRGRVIISVRDYTYEPLRRPDVVPKDNFIEVPRLSSDEAAALFQACLPRRPNGIQELGKWPENFSSLDVLPLTIVLSAIRQGYRPHSQPKELDGSKEPSSDDQRSSHPNPTSLSAWVRSSLSLPARRCIPEAAIDSTRIFPGLNLNFMEPSSLVLLVLLCLFQRPRIPEYIVRPIYTALAVTDNELMDFDEAAAQLQKHALTNSNDDEDEYEASSLIREWICAVLESKPTIEVLNVIIAELSSSFPELKSSPFPPDFRVVWGSQSYLVSLCCGVIQNSQRHNISTKDFARLLYKTATAMVHLRIAELAAEYSQLSLDIYSRFEADVQERIPVMELRLLAATLAGDEPTIISLGVEYLEVQGTAVLKRPSSPYLLQAVINALSAIGDVDTATKISQRTFELGASNGMYTPEQLSHLRTYFSSLNSSASLPAPHDIMGSIRSILNSEETSRFEETIRLFFEGEHTADQIIHEIFFSPRRGVYHDPYSILMTLLTYFDNMDRMNYSQTNRIRTIGSRLLDRMPTYTTPQQIGVTGRLADTVGMACILEGDWADAELYYSRAFDTFREAKNAGYQVSQEDYDQAAYNVALSLCLQTKTQEVEEFEQRYADELARVASSQDGKDFKNDAMLFFVTDAVRRAEQRGETNSRAVLLEALRNKLLEFDINEE